MTGTQTGAAQDTGAAGGARRIFIAGLGALGATAAVATWIARRPAPPSGEPLELDLAAIAPGALRMIEWHGRSVWVLHRTPAQVAALVAPNAELLDPDSQHSLQPEACRNATRSLRPEWLVALAECTHQGCAPQLRNEGAGAFLCPCHTSRFDLAGRAFRAGPAPANLTVPEYRFASDTRLVLGQA